ncbi:MAG: hypothetical protein Q9166_003391 [cf. Caloplaca sp. 2 TL-2023]
MAGLKEFVGNRMKPSDDDDTSAKDAARRQARLTQLGINRQLNGVKTRDINDTGGRSSSRQAIAAQSRVSTGAFSLQRPASSQHTLGQRHRASEQTPFASNPVNHSRGSLHGPSHASPKSSDMFGTDIENLDDTTIFSTFADPTDHPGNLKDDSANGLHSETRPNDSGSTQINGEYWDQFSNGPTASPRSSRYVEADDEHDGDDETDGQSQYRAMLTDENPISDQRHTKGAFSANRKRQANEALPDPEHERKLGNFPNALNDKKALRDLRLSGSLPQGHRKIHSSKAVSVSSNENESEMDDSMPPYSPGVDQFSVGIRDSTAEPGKHKEGNPMPRSPDAHQDTVNAKRKHTSDLDLQRSTNSSLPLRHTISNVSNAGAMQEELGDLDGVNQQPQPHKRNADIGLDYDLKALGKMTFQQLADESFDTAPRPTKRGESSLKEGTTLDEKLLHLHSLDGPRDDIQSQRQAFFSSLPIHQYEECGDLMAERFSQIISQFKQARQQKRALAKEFEEEVAARQKLVERRKIAVAEDLDRLKRAGQDVVRGK